MTLRVGVLYGGPSAEHEVSVVSARCVIEAIDRDRFDVVPIAITKQGRWLLPERGPEALPAPDGGMPAVEDAGEEIALARGGALLSAAIGARRTEIDVAFPLVHGTYGEDGTLQGALEVAGVPYVGAGVEASAVGMDKELQKGVWERRSLPVAPHAVVASAADAERIDGALGSPRMPRGYPLFVKPARLGSSIGISKCRDLAELRAGIEVALAHDSKALVEQAIAGREIECAVLGNDDPEAAPALAEIVPADEFYSYEAKYLAEGSKVVVPAPLSAPAAEELRGLAIDAFGSVGCRGMARVDFFLDGDRPVLNEINTIPGFTPISAYPKMWDAAGLSYPRLVERLIALALE